MDLCASKILLRYLTLFYDFKIGRKSIIRGLPIISLASQSSIRIGEHAYLISRSRNTALGVNHPVVLRTLKANSRIRIGCEFKASGVTLCAANNITIGDRVMMGANVTVADTDFHSSNPAVRFSNDDSNNAQDAKVTIGDEVFVGMNAIILKGVSIGRAAIIGAGSVVTRDVPDGAVVAGNPAIER